MGPIQQLVAEHDTILRGLALLEAVAGRLDAGQDVPAELVAWLPSFLADFADSCHHAKEEDLLFPMLQERGLPPQGGPVAVMLHEHVLGRACVQRMQAAGGADPAEYTDAAVPFVALLRQHIFKENNVLFRMAGQLLSEADQQALGERFAQTASEKGLAEVADRYRAELERWEGALDFGA